MYPIICQFINSIKPIKPYLASATKVVPYLASTAFIIDCHVYPSTIPPIKLGMKNTVRKKLVPFIFLVKKYAKVKSGSKKGSKETVGSLTKEQIKEIATIKLPDLNCYTVEEAIKIVTGTAKNMGITVEE